MYNIPKNFSIVPNLTRYDRVTIKHINLPIEVDIVERADHPTSFSWYLIKSTEGNFVAILTEYRGRDPNGVSEEELSLICLKYSDL
jgi:hypothetical protein